MNCVQCDQEERRNRAGLKTENQSHPEKPWLYSYQSWCGGDNVGRKREKAAPLDTGVSEICSGDQDARNTEGVLSQKTKNVKKKGRAEEKEKWRSESWNAKVRDFIEEKNPRAERAAVLEK